MNETLIFISADELVKLPPEPISLNAVLDAMLTYCPDHMHGIPKKRYVNFLKREIASPDRAEGIIRKFNEQRQDKNAKP